MNIQSSNRLVGNILVLELKGRIVCGDETAYIREHIGELLRGHPHIVLDVAGVNYIDSTGLGTLVGLYTSARNAGGDVKLANLTRGLKDVLQITKLATVFQTFENVDDAVADFNVDAASKAAAVV